MRLRSLGASGVCALGLCVGGLVGCSSGRGGLAALPATVPVDVTSTTTLVVAEPSTTVAVANSVAPPETDASTIPATVAPTPAPPIRTPIEGGSPLQLRSDGFGLFPFGTPLTDVLVGSPGELGPPTADTTTDFPTASDAGFATADGSLGFTLPVAREYCWSEFCLNFGGATRETLTLVGWRYQTSGEVPAVVLTNADGITLGSRWSDFPKAMAADPGGCYTVGAGSTTDGIFLVLQGGLFSQFREDGTYEVLLPDPAEVTVLGMDAGAQIQALEGDC